MLRPFAVLPLVVVTSTGFPAVAQDSWLTAAIEDAQGGPLAETIQMASLKKSQTLAVKQHREQLVKRRWPRLLRAPPLASALLLLMLALLILISGFTFLQPALNPQEHPWRVILFWIVCIWLTFTALLLALFDLLVLRLQARRAQRALHKKLGSDAGRSTSSK